MSPDTPELVLPWRTRNPSAPIRGTSPIATISILPSGPLATFSASRAVGRPIREILPSDLRTKPVGLDLIVEAARVSHIVPRDLSPRDIARPTPRSRSAPTPVARARGPGSRPLRNPGPETPAGAAPSPPHSLELSYQVLSASAGTPSCRRLTREQLQSVRTSIARGVASRFLA